MNWSLMNCFCWIAEGFPGSSDGKESAYNVGDPGSVPGLGRFPGEGIGNPLQYSCLENPMDRGTWWTAVHGVPKSWTQPSEHNQDLRHSESFSKEQTYLKLTSLREAVMNPRC